MKMKKPLRAMLSIFLSVLMLSSPLAGLGSVFAAAVDPTPAATELSLADALTAYANDASDNNRFRVLEALGPIVSSLTVKLSSQPSIKNGELKGGTDGANFMGELRDAVLEQAGIGGDEFKLALIKEFIPTVGGTAEFRSLANYRKAVDGSGQAEFVLDETPGDVTVTATREASDAIADFAAGAIPDEVVTEYSITYHCASWQNSAVTYSAEDGAITGAAATTFEFYYFSALPTIDKKVTDISAQKAIIDAFTAQFGANESSKGAAMTAYLKDSSKLFGRDDLADIAEQSFEVYYDLLDLGIAWWGGIVSADWVNGKVAEFLAAIDGAAYARALGPIVDRMNDAANAYTKFDKDLEVGSAEFNEAYYTLLKSYIDLSDWVAKYSALLSKSDNKNVAAAANLTALKDWSVYNKLLTKEIKDIRSFVACYASKLLFEILDELAAAQYSDAEVEAQYNEQYLDYIDAYLSDDGEGVTLPAEDESGEFEANVEYYDDSISDERLEYFLGVLSGISQVLSQSLEEAAKEDIEEEMDDVYAVQSLVGVANNVYLTLASRNGRYAFSDIAYGAEAAVKAAYSVNVDQPVDQLIETIDEVKGYLGVYDDIDALVNAAIELNEYTLFVKLERQVYDAKAVFDLEGEVNYANADVFKVVGEDISSAIYDYLSENGSDYAKGLLSAPKPASAPTAGLILIAHAAGDTFDDVYDAVTDSVNGAASWTRVNLETSGSSYTIRYGNTSLDLARITGENYQVTNGRVSDTITKLDNFLKSSDLTNLINLKKENPDGTESPYMLNGHEVQNLNELIEAILREKLYSDEIMNKLVGTIYPMICNLVKVQLSNVLFYNNPHYNPIDLSTMNIKASSGSWGGGVDGMSGNVYLYFNGPHSTSKFKDLLHNAHLDIYPQYLAAHMNSYGFGSIGTKLSNAANWSTPDQGANTGYLGDFPGDWQAVYLSPNVSGHSQGDVYQYNPYLYTVVDGEYVLDFNWGINGSEAVFKQALTAIISSILPVAQIVLGGKTDYSTYLGSAGYAIGDPIHADAYATLAGTDTGNVSVRLYVKASAGATIKITTTHGEGGSIVYGYRDILAPIFEALGVDNYTSNTCNLASYVPSQNDSAVNYVNGLVEPLKKLITQITTSPVDKILSILPTLAYALRNDAINGLLRNLTLNLTMDLSIEDIDEASVGASWLDLDWILDLFKSKINSALPTIRNSINIGGKIDLADLLDVTDITDINAIIKGVLAKSDNEKLKALVNALPYIDQTQLSQLGTSLSTPSSQRWYGTRYYVPADKPDVLWWLLKYLGTAMANETFRNSIKDMMISDGDDDDSILSTIISAIGNDPNAFGAAIIELFNPISYAHATYSQWTTANASFSELRNQGGSSYVYLKYGNDWTYEKAEALVEGTNEILTTLLKKNLEEDGYDSFADWLDTILGKGFNERNVTNFIKFMANIGDSLDNYQLNYILSRFTSNGLNIHAWADTFGYLYDTDETPAEERHLSPGQTGYTNNFPGLVPTIVDKIDTATGEVVVDPVTGEAEKDVKWTYTSGGQTYSFVTVLDSEALTAEQRAQNRQAFQEMMGCIFQPLSPVIDIFLSGANGALFPTTANPNGVLTILGNNGYETAIVPLFEALGVPNANIKTQSEFNALGNYDAKLTYVMNTAFDWLAVLDGASDGSDNIVNNTMTKLAPYLLQFLESNGLSVIVRELLKPLLTTIDTLRPLLGVNLNNVLGKVVGDILDQVLTDPQNIEFEFPKGQALLNAANTYNIQLRDLGINALLSVIGSAVNKALENKGSDNRLDLSPLKYGIENILALEHSTQASKSTVYTQRVVFSESGEAKYNRANAANILTVAVSMLLDLAFEGNNIGAIADLLGNFIDDEETLAKITEYIDLVEKVKAFLRDTGSAAAYLREPNWFYINGSHKDGTGEIVLPGRTIYYLRYGKGIDTNTDLFAIQQLPDDVNLWTSELAHKLIDSIPALADMAVQMLTKGQEVSYASASEFIQGIWNEKVGNAFSPKTIGGLAEMIYGFIPAEVMQFQDILNVFLNIDLDTWKDTYLEEVDKTETVVDEETGEETEVPVIDEETGETVKVWQAKEAWQSEEAYATNEEFSTALTNLLAPLDEILSWLLVGKDYRFFYSKTNQQGGVSTSGDAQGTVAQDQIILAGGQGYARCLVPILEAFDCEPAALQAGDTGVSVLAYTITALLDKIESVVKSDDPVNGVLDLLPNLLYFINANGLTTSLINLVAPIAPLITELGSVLIDKEKEENAAILEVLEDESISGYDKLIAVADALIVSAIPEDSVLQLPEGFSLGDVDLETVLGIVEATLGIKIYDAVTMTVEGTIDGIDYSVATGYNYLENFYYGDIRKKASANGLDRYYATFTDATDESKADLLTILIYTVFDVLNYKVDGEYPNDLAIAALIDKDDPEAMAEKIAAIRDMLQIFIEETYDEYDWFYFNEDLSEMADEEAAEFYAKLASGEADLSEYATTMDYVLESYFTYRDEDQRNLWNATTALRIKNALKEVIDSFIPAIVAADEDVSNDAMTTANQYLNSIWERSNPLDDKLLCTIGSAIGSIFSQLDNETLLDLIGAVLDVSESDWAAWKAVINQYTEIEDPDTYFTEENNHKYEPAEFVDKILEMVTPIHRILDWILFDQDIQVFYLNNNDAAISIDGAKGFEEGILPILEVLNCDLGDARIEDLDGISAIELTANALIGKFEAVLNSEDPVGTIIDMIPQILYFINSNGLCISLNNLLGPIEQLIEKAAPLLASEEEGEESEPAGFDLVKLLKLDEFGIESLEDFRLKDVIKLVEAILAKNDIELHIYDALSLNGENFLDTFALGKLVKKVSTVNDRTYYTMEYNDELDSMNIFTVVLCAVFDILNYQETEGVYPNDQGIANIISKDDPEKILAILPGIRAILHTYVEPAYMAYDWFYFNPELANMTDEEAEAFFAALESGEADLSEYADTMDYILESYLSYSNEDQKNLWNKAMAERVRDNFKDIVDLVIQRIVASDDDESNDGLTTANAYLNDLWNTHNPLNKRLEYTIGAAIANILDNLQNDKLVDLIGIALGVGDDDWAAWKAVISQYEGIEDVEAAIPDSENTVYTVDEFVDIIMSMLTPLGKLLDWFFFGEDNPIEILYLKTGDPAIEIQGVNAFEEGILPMLNALDCDLDGLTLEEMSGLDALETTVRALVDKFNAILTADDPVDVIAKMIPQILYFINSNGLCATLNNVTGSVKELLAKLPAIVGEENFSEDLANLDIVSLLNLNDYGIEDLENFRLADAFRVVETVLANNDIDLKIYDALTKDGENFLDTFAIGKLQKLTYYTAEGEENTHYTMKVNDDLDTMNLFTILICSAIDVFKYEGNKDFWAGLLGGEDKYDAIIDMMVTTLDEASFANYDWFYFDPENVDASSFPEDGATVPVSYEKSTMGYLEYSNNWNLETAEYIQDQFYDIVDTVMKNATDYDTLNAFIKDKWSGVNLYNWDTVNKLGASIGGFIGDLDGTLKTVITTILDVDLNTWDKYVNEENTGAMTKEQFIDELINIVTPVDFLLDWLLAGKTISLFYTKDGYELTDGSTSYDAIRLEGAQGFNNAIVPILEALNIDLSDLADLEAPTGLDYLRYALEKVLGEIDDIAAAEDTVRALVDKIPNLLYFINANGLSVSVRNLLVPVTNLLENVTTLIDKPEYSTLQSIVDELLKDNDKLAGKIDVENLDIVAIIGIVEALTGLEINGSVTYRGVNLFETFAIGEVERYTSANGKTAYKMNYVPGTLGVDDSELAYIDVLTILVAAAVNIVRNDNNGAPLVKLLGDNGENVYTAIRNILDLDEYDIDYLQYKWLFTIKNYTKKDPKVGVVSPMNRSIVFREGYDQYWTVAKADYVAENLNKVVDNTMRLLGIRVKGFDLSDLETTLEFLLEDYAYTTDNMTKISGKVLTYIEKIEEIDPNGHIEALINDSLGVDLSEYKKYADGFEWQFESGDRDGFIDAIVEFLSPLYPVLRWLLLDEELAFFNDVDKSDLVVLPGGQGYEKAIIPLLEAFDYKNPNIKTLAQYKADIEADPDNLIRDILNPLLDFVDYITEDPLNHLLDRLPGLIYFINSDGLDTAFKNVLHPVYVILNAIEPLVKVDLYELMNFDLSKMDMEYVIGLAIDKLLPDYADEIKEPALNSIAELTLGKVIGFTSKNGEKAFTMEYVEDKETQMAGKADMITVVLRLTLKWLTMEENQGTVQKMIKENIPDEETRAYVLATYDTFIQYLAKPHGITMMMGLAYYVFFGWDVASAETLERLDETNDDWKFMIGMIDSSEDGYIQAFAEMMHKFFGQTTDVVDEEGFVSHGFVPMIQKLINWIKAIIEWFKNIFKAS